MNIEKLRDLHPRFVYKSYKATGVKNELVVVYTFLLEPDITFESTLRFPFKKDKSADDIKEFLFLLGMVEAISYWKTACPKEFVVEAGAITQEAKRFFEDLMLHGLGEFYYVNKIDFTKDQFVTIVGTVRKEPSPIEIVTKPTDLVLVGGGKDSALLLSLLLKGRRQVRPLVINPSIAALETIKALGIENPLVVTREMDAKLKEFNSKGYLNGHTPFSALLSFVGATVAAIFGHENVAVANEQSASEGNIVYKGVEINHQYSKSLRYENLFREFLKSELSPSFSYFSALRSFNDIQISKMFSHVTPLLPVFRSCNRFRNVNRWCGACAKCAFTYLTLFPFLSYEQAMNIFGEDYFLKNEIIVYLRELVGITEQKPFECVGTRDESRLALLLSLKKYSERNMEIPEGLLRVKIEAGLKDADLADYSARVLDHISSAHNVPDEYTAILLDAWKKS